MVVVDDGAARFFHFVIRPLLPLVSSSWQQLKTVARQTHVRIKDDYFSWNQIVTETKKARIYIHNIHVFTKQLQRLLNDPHSKDCLYQQAWWCRIQVANDSSFLKFISANVACSLVIVDGLNGLRGLIFFSQTLLQQNRPTPVVYTKGHNWINHSTTVRIGSWYKKEFCLYFCCIVFFQIIQE